MKGKRKPKYSLYLASGIYLWKTEFSSRYSKHFNRRIALFEPGTINTPTEHRLIPITIATFDLDKVNHADALLVYMKHYKTPDGSPTGTDSAWECGYGIAMGKPAIMLIEDLEHIDYYASQWMVSFSINAILTTSKEVAEAVKNHPKFVHTTILLATNPDQFEAKITEYLDNYYRSIYSRSGIINYSVDERARELFSRQGLEKNVFTSIAPSKSALSELKPLQGLKFVSESDSLKACRAERNISKKLEADISEKTLDSAISSTVKAWNVSKEHVLDCLQHSIKPPFEKVSGRKQGVKKTRPELFFELFDLATHHLVKEKRFVKSETFPFDVGAVTELYNWMNTYSLDDVFDNSEFRQKLETVWKQFSRKDAIFTGILGHLLALKYILQIASESPSTAKKMASIMNAYNRTMYRGQVLDIVLTFDSKKKRKLLSSNNQEKAFELYIQRIYGICGGFYEAIGELAAKAGNKEEQIMNAPEIDRVSPLVGMHYGIIQMIRNDLGDYIMPEDFSKLSKGMKDVSHSDIEEGKADIAYLTAIYSPHLSSKEKSFLAKSLHKKLSLKEKARINELLWKSGAIDFTVELIIRLIAHVKENLLSHYHETPTRMKWMFDLVTITKEILTPFRKQALRNDWTKYEFDPKLLESLAEKIISLDNKSMEQRLSRLADFKALL